MRMLRTVLITLLSLFCLTSCKIDGEEEITLKEDGSGSLRICYTLPYRAFSAKDSEELLADCIKLCDQHPTLKWQHGNHKPVGYGFQKIEFCIDFQSIDAFTDAVNAETSDPATPTDSSPSSSSPSIVKTMLGNIHFHPDWQGLNFKRDIDLSPLFKGKVNDPRVLGNAEFRYILHLPHNAGNNNATEVSQDGKSLVWKIPLQKHIDTAFTIQFGVRIGWMPWCWVGGALLCLLLLWFIWRFVFRRLFIPRGLGF